MDCDSDDCDSDDDSDALLEPDELTLDCELLLNDELEAELELKDDEDDDMLDEDMLLLLLLEHGGALGGTPIRAMVQAMPGWSRSDFG